MLNTINGIVLDIKCVKLPCKNGMLMMPGKADISRGRSMGIENGKKEIKFRVDINHTLTIKIIAAKNRSRFTLLFVLLFILSGITLSLRPNSSKSSLLSINLVPEVDQ